MRNYHGKVAVITGGAGGIGRGLARRFAEAGARIALLDLPSERLDAAATELTDLGLEAFAVACDVTDPGACDRAMTAVLDRWGHIDILFANAGIVHRSAVRSTSPDVIRRVMEVNFLGAVHAAQAALEPLLASRGQIVVTSSIAGVAPLLGRAGYSASKYALHGFFESLRAELSGTGVDVTMVCPGFVDSGFDSRAIDGTGSLHQRGRSQVGDCSPVAPVAEAIFRGVRRNRRTLVLTPIGKVSYGLSRLWPAAFERLMTRMLRSEIEPDTAKGRP